jgi:DNA repair protein SbcD/Mre11
MKIIHTSDWHLGRIFNGVNLIDDQEYVLKNLVGILRSEKPDVLVVAGDIYDRSVSSEQAIRLLNDIILTIVFDLKIKTIIISGNHDSGERLNFGSRLMRDNGLYIASNTGSFMERIELGDEYGTVNFWTIPYYSPSLIKSEIDGSVHCHNDVYRVLLDRIGRIIDDKERNVLVTHAFLTGCETTDESESPLSVGGTSEVSSDYFTMFNYVALGHLHKPQKVKDEKIRYSGSLLQYSFSEISQEKIVNKIMIDGNGKVSVEVIPLVPKHPLRIIEGQFDEIFENAKSDKNQEDYIKIRVLDRTPVFNPMERLKSFYPNLLQFERARLTLDVENRVTGIGREIDRISDRDLILRFYRDMTGDEFELKNINVLDELLGEFNDEAGAE